MQPSTLPSSTGSLAMYLAEINKYPLLTVDEEQRLARLYAKSGDLDAAHKLVTSNLRFVVKVAYEYRSYGIKMADLIQEGNIGLMKAVQKFDADKGIRLISYAVWWIRAFIQNYILKSWSLVKLGTTQAQRKLFFSLARTRRELEKFDGVSGYVHKARGRHRQEAARQTGRGPRDAAAHGGARPLARCADGRGRRLVPRRLRAGRRRPAGRGDRRAGRAPHRPGARPGGAQPARSARALHHRAADHERQADDAEGAGRALRLLARAGAAAGDPRQGQAGGRAGRADGRAVSRRRAHAVVGDGLEKFGGSVGALRRRARFRDRAAPFCFDAVDVPARRGPRLLVRPAARDRTGAASRQAAALVFGRARARRGDPQAVRRP